ncbi:hypothetical protein K9U39_01065 [Rhodoblastus acidophilus]|uniref:IrrE N-terminal-like domain-containing protein n=1 Tax=Candidatus Rhodoblastus alkanivorans TaxID=2954117 RepID=A0ABS9Z3K1_9HYPH|nr:hypothetical protein [Candidatus Rhodoblastus alkanivorans]MCI4680517.1 hypothetical protein [Candidatus Rhodoblastus alkanivorans]MCI4682243.1 hypothetical protein [Candidatus Rhodoblastus alkanivorans]MDI4639545.1 hypothetical protein [Rhodoblastus acidophilus]
MADPSPPKWNKYGIGDNFLAEAGARAGSKRTRLCRRTFLLAGTFGVISPFVDSPSFARGRTDRVNLLSAPIELSGNWDHMIPAAAMKVVGRMRLACLTGVRLVSDRQPTVLRVDEHLFGPPAVWLHAAEPTTAWVIVDIGERDWSKLAYQFGHELGHVLANSWRFDARPARPCQWLEEAIVEAFSIRGLGKLAEDWKRNPPFPNDNAFGDAIAKYRQNIIDRYSQLGREQGMAEGLAAWLRNNRAVIEASALGPFAKAASLTILAEYERRPKCVEALGALNRWKGRTAVPIDAYLRSWVESCAQLAADSYLPVRLQELLRV